MLRHEMVACRGLLMADQDVIQKLIFECFDRLTKIDQDSERKINYLTRDVLRRKIDPVSLERILNRHIEISRYAPKLSDIYEIQRVLVTEHSHDRIIDFLQRFKAQGSNGRGMDNDVYTVKRAIGDVRVETSTLDQWHWIEKEARVLYIDLLQGKVKIEQSPTPSQQKSLPRSSKTRKVDKAYFDGFLKNAKESILRAGKS